MKKTIYESPAIIYAGIDLEGFICESADRDLAVDEYQILNEEAADF